MNRVTHFIAICFLNFALFSQPYCHAAQLRLEESIEKIVWQKLPALTETYDFSGDKLQKAWPQLHSEDGHPFPSESVIAQQLEKNPGFQPNHTTDLNHARSIALQLQNAWQLIHEGNLQAGFKKAFELGPIGYYTAGQAIYINSYYLTKAQEDQYEQYLLILKLVAIAKPLEPKDRSLLILQNYALGRYLEHQPFRTRFIDDYHQLKNNLDELADDAAPHLGVELLAASFHASAAIKSPFLSKIAFGSDLKKALRKYQKTLLDNPNTIVGHIAFAEDLLATKKPAYFQQAKQQLEKARQINPWDAPSELAWQQASSRIVNDAYFAAHLLDE